MGFLLSLKVSILPHHYSTPQPSSTTAQADPFTIRFPSVLVSCEVLGTKLLCPGQDNPSTQSIVLLAAYPPAPASPQHRHSVVGSHSDLQSTWTSDSSLLPSPQLTKEQRISPSFSDPVCPALAHYNLLALRVTCRILIPTMGQD